MNFICYFRRVNPKILYLILFIFNSFFLSTSTLPQGEWSTVPGRGGLVSRRVHLPDGAL